MRSLAFVMAAIVLGSMSTSAMAAVDLEPTAEWRLREYEDKCRMSRTFGEGDDAVTLWIEKGGPGRYFNITAIGRPFRNPYGQRVNIGFTPNEMQARGFVTSTSSSGRPVITLFGVQIAPFEKDPVDDPDLAERLAESLDLSQLREWEPAAPEVLAERLNAIHSLDLSGPLAEKVSLKTGSMLPVVTQLADCTNGMLEKRASAVRAGTGLSRGPSTIDEREWAGQIQINYPSYLLREMAEGSVGVRVAVSPEGRAAFCEVTAFIGPAGFNDAACLAMLRHSRFTPARDQSGQPVWGTYATRITYRIN